MLVETNCPTAPLSVVEAAANTCWIGRYVGDSLVHDRGEPCCRVHSIDSKIAKGMMLQDSSPGLDLLISWFTHHYLILPS